MEEKITTEIFKTKLSELLDKYNKDQGHCVTEIRLNATIDSVPKRVLYYNIEITVE